MRFKGTAAVWREEDRFIALCAENNITSQGKTMEAAMENLKEALMLNYSS